MSAEAGQIREAIRCEQYKAALGRWNSYARGLRTALDAGTLRSDQMEEARRLYEWSRMALLGARAHLQARLRELAVAARYSRRQSSSHSRTLSRF